MPSICRGHVLLHPFGSLPYPLYGPIPQGQVFRKGEGLTGTGKVGKLDRRKTVLLVPLLLTLGKLGLVVEREDQRVTTPGEYDY